MILSVLNELLNVIETNGSAINEQTLELEMLNKVEALLY